MAEGSVITEEMTRAVGSLLNTAVIEVEKGKIKQYVKAMGETSPLYQDEEYARKSRYGGLIAPPGLLATQKMSGGASRDVPWKEREFLKNSVDAGEKFEFYKPVRPGDIVFLTRKLRGLSERKSKSLGRMRLTEFEVTYTNQKGEVIAKETKTSMMY